MTMFYPKLAASGMKRNAQLYAPYLLTCVLMVAMEYIVLFLVRSPAIGGLPGTEILRMMLSMGSGIIALFSAIFLFYTYSFLRRRRMKEFGLYNMLGMGRWQLGWILVWETLLTAAAALGLGLAAGMALSKLSELVLIRLVEGNVSFMLSVSMASVKDTLLIFGVIFAVILLNSLIQLHRTSAVTLMKSEQQGEKPPKANWVLGLGGAVVLGYAYWLAVSIEEPVSAMVWFFAAAALVIVATYLLFMAGSVLLCRILQKNKRYYYQSAHFVSVASMKYRMKRNGAGLASICILGTMVLVSLSSSACLYIGSENTLQLRYPEDIAVNVRFERIEEMEEADAICQSVDGALAALGTKPENARALRWVELSGGLSGTVLEPDVDRAVEMGMYANLRTVHFIPLEDYNRLAGAQESLAQGEALVYAFQTTYDGDTFSVRDQLTLRVKKHLEDFPFSGEMAILAAPVIVVVVEDVQTILPLSAFTYNTGNLMAAPRLEYGFDLPQGDEAGATKVLRGANAVWRVESRRENREDYYSTYGGLLFLGILLSFVFLVAAVLIIYYKQISEGYEDQGRFAIMQKVGMTRREIRKSINSQMLTVFLLPLVTAGLHLVFAFPMVRKMLLLFNLYDTGLLIATTAVSFAAFAVFYLAVYRITSNTYFKLVSQKV